MTWDHIIVGGGSAGAVLANRLSADERRRVLLIEAGPDTPPGEVPEIILDSYPGLAYFDPRYHWTRLRIFNESLAANRQRPRPRRFEQGRVMGGGSSINGQFAIRGLPWDYDEWAAMGLAGWGHADVLPYFRKLERDLDFSGEAHGGDDSGAHGADNSGAHGANGPIPIRRVFPEDWPGFSRAVLEALEAEGHGYFADHNAEAGDGSFPMALSNQGDRRVSTAIAYLDAATRKRGNLRILADSEVRGIVMDGRRAVGVDVARGGAVEHFVGDEIIVSAGALHSPALLMRAGIGPGGHLKDKGVAVAADRPGVGENLQEHPQVIATAILAPGARLPPAVRRHIFLGARYSSGHQGCPPGDMFLTVTNKSGWHPLGRRLGSILAAVYKPYSQGCVRLASADPRDEPVVAFNLAGDGRDLARLVDGMRRVYRIFAAPAVRGSTLGLFPSTFDDHVREMMVPSLATWLKTGVVALAIDAGPLTRRLAERFALSPGADIHQLMADDEALEDWVRDKVCGGWHATGTCRMGADGDPLAVLDARCRVRGVEGLRVVDASVMPTSVSANTNITTIMIAEKIAAEILAG